MVIHASSFIFAASLLAIFLGSTSAVHPSSSSSSSSRVAAFNSGLVWGPRLPRPLVRSQMIDNDFIAADSPNLKPQEEQAFELIVPNPSEAIAVVPPPVAEPPTNTKNNNKVSLTVLQQRIVRRLNTHEDFMGVHKISAAMWLVSLTYIAGVGLFNGFSDIPESLELVTWIALVTSFVQGVTGYDMAIKYRANDPLVQKGMINTSFQMISSATAGFYISPFAPDAFNDFHLGNGFFVATVIPSVIMGIDEVFKMRQTLEKRRLRNKEFSEDFGLVGDLSSYGFASLSGFVGATMALIFAANPYHDRAWILDAASRGAFSCPNFIPENYYAVALFNLSIGVGIFAITLRDKKLISKSVEQTLVAFFTLPAAFLTLHASPF